MGAQPGDEGLLVSLGKAEIKNIWITIGHIGMRHVWTKRDTDIQTVHIKFLFERDFRCIVEIMARP
jgi:hypothetical protein